MIDPRSSPAVQLRLLLEEAREAGISFDDAWTPCLRRVKWPHDTAHRLEWKGILGDGKEHKTPRMTLLTWRAAYYREPPSRQERVLATLVAA